MSQTPVTVVIADDNELFCSALEAILAPDGRVEVLGWAGDGEEAVRLAGRVRPDVALVDLSMPVVDGFAATRRIRAELPETRVIVLTGSADEADVARAREAGAVGYVTKDRIAADLVAAILAAAAG